MGGFTILPAIRDLRAMATGENRISNTNSPKQSDFTEGNKGNKADRKYM